MANNNFKMKHFQLALSSQNLYQVQLKKPFFFAYFNFENILITSVWK